MSNEVDYEARRVTLAKPTPAYYLNLDEAKRVSKSSKEEPKFSLNYAFDPDSADLQAIRTKIISQAVAFANSSEDGAADFRAVAGTSSASIIQAIKDKTIKIPIEDGDVLADKGKQRGKNRDYWRGKKVLTARTTKFPAVAIVSNGQIVDLTEQSEVKLHKAKFFYGGVHCVGDLDIVAYGPVGDGGKPGVTAYLSSVVSTGRGEKVAGSGPNLAERFKGHVGLETEEHVSDDEPDNDW